MARLHIALAALAIIIPSIDNTALAQGAPQTAGLSVVDMKMALNNATMQPPKNLPEYKDAD